MEFKTKIVLIRHGMTPGNRLRRYIGITDDPLLPESIEQLQEKQSEMACLFEGNPFCKCFVSPLLRCRQTATALFPKTEQIVVEDFHECDFGLFENKTNDELTGDPDYQRFIDSNGQTPFPEGEDPAEFKDRVNKAFELLANEFANAQITNEHAAEETTFEPLCIVAHGGTIMSILSRFAKPEKTFYDWMLGNGAYYVGTLCVDTEEGNLQILEISKHD